MKNPTFGELGIAVQNPNFAFRDPDLRECRPELTPLGLPKPRSGGFAVTYKLVSGTGQAWAVRCFHLRVGDLEQRYKDISKHLSTSRQPYFSSFQFQAEGIRIGNDWHPIVKMPWVIGSTLDTYLDRIHKHPIQVRKLAERFRDIAKQLELLGVAHGDLQHGNILANESGITLIDYDGMYVPKMSVSTASELGHVNYQSPMRTASHFGSYIDRFSASTISLALDALVHDSTLWDRYSVGDNILFTSKDFLNPTMSPLLEEMSRLPGMRERIATFRHLCSLPLDYLPTLEEFYAGEAHANVTVPAALVERPQARLHQFDVISALARDTFLRKNGEMVQVVGQIVDVFSGTAVNRQPYAFINFADWRQQNFRLVVWSEQLRQFNESSGTVSQLRGKWVTITGLVTLYKGVPQIVVEEARSLRTIHGGESEAQRMIAESTADQTIQQPTMTNPRDTRFRNPHVSKTTPVSTRTTAATEPSQPDDSSNAAKSPKTPNQEKLRAKVKLSSSQTSASFPVTQPSNHSNASPRSKSANQSKLEELRKLNSTSSNLVRTQATAGTTFPPSTAPSQVSSAQSRPRQTPVASSFRTANSKSHNQDGGKTFFVKMALFTMFMIIVLAILLQSL